MAKGNNGNGSPEAVKPLAGLTPEIWAKACADAGFSVDENGNAVIGISGDSGDGYLVSIPAPVGIDPENLARALLGHALRVGQQGIKAKDATPSRELATTSANSALNGGYSPQRERATDIAAREAERIVEGLVTAAVKAKVPDASEDDIAASVKKYCESEAGKAKLAETRREVLERGTYKVSRKGKGTGSVVEITL